VKSGGLDYIRAASCQAPPIFLSNIRRSGYGDQLMT
jgi:hypothetical protein